MVRPLPVPRNLIDFIQTGSKFLIAGHHEPDGDCVGSQLALTSALKRLGKEAIPCSAGPFKRTEIVPFADRFKDKIGEPERAGSRVIILDCAAADRTGGLEGALKGLPTAIIDHHATNREAAPETAAFLDTEAPSVTFLVLAVIEALGLTPTPEEAGFLLFGLCTDTGFFRHVDTGGAETFAYASRMIRAGANPKNVFQAMHGGKSLGSRILLGHILARAETHYGGKLVYSFETYEDTRKFGLEGRDSDSLYQLLQSIAGVEAIMVIRQESAQDCTVGLRSRDLVNVAEIAARFGGGGHKNAAGVKLAGTIEELKPRFIEAFAGQLADGPDGPGGLTA
ncbi:MAG: bifunctional oligoribonuclease/PAP phosphatase NrnA [Treponema sp.]|jgi:phosphoesterase RecJ-like protein|nr:bifunctional oligoribonuclease/PAP phosphatase NrnA [Treponema sp.]